MSSTAEVEAELAKLKGRSQPQAIEAAEDGGDILKAEPVAEPVAEPIVEPVAEPVTESAAEPAEGETRP
jgi:hypothetical protein